MHIDILLSTYNSELFLKELVESIRLQTNANWRLIIRDDCSKDNTQALIEKYIGDNSNIDMKLTFNLLFSFNYLKFCTVFINY